MLSIISFAQSYDVVIKDILASVANWITSSFDDTVSKFQNLITGLQIFDYYLLKLYKIKKSYKYQLKNKKNIIKFRINVCLVGYISTYL